MKRFIWLLLLLPMTLWGQTTQDRSLTGWCYMGATKASMSGMSSTNTLQGVIPSCTVTVYLTGTITLATLHADSAGGVLGNPFTATTQGFWLFWTSPNQAYDIVLSGGRPGNTYPQPVTLTAIQVGGPGAGGATPPGGNNFEMQFNANGFFGGTTGMTWNSAQSFLNYPAGTIGAQHLFGNSIAVAQSGSYQINFPYSGSGLSAQLVACLGADGTAHPCPVGSASWNGITTATGTTLAVVAINGQASCLFDNQSAVGDYVVLSTTIAGNCHDTGATTPPLTAGLVSIGVALAANTGAGTAAIVTLQTVGVAGTVNASTVTATGTINGASVNASGGAYQIAIPWNTGLPNMTNGLVGCTTGIGTVYACPVNSFTWNGIQVGGGPGSGSANSTLAVGGQVSCTFDNSATVGDYAQLSQITAGKCHDSGLTTLPSNGVPVVGQVVALGTAPQATVLLAPSGLSSMPGPPGPPGSAGPPGGSLSYPGVVSDSNNGLNVQGATNTASLPGYRQNNVNARSRNRDEILQLTVTPQDMPNCANSGKGLIDDAPCFCAAIQYLSSTDFNVTRKLTVPYTQYGYTFRSNCALQPLPHDFGDYNGFAGYTNQANVGLTIINGQVISCTFSGGAGYTASTTSPPFTVQLPVYIFDPSLKGSGAYATVSTDTTGTPNGCTVVQPGINYPQTGVIASVLPVGGDGAAGTAFLQSNGTLVLGAITSSTSASTIGQLTSGGSGYQTYQAGVGYPAVSLGTGGTSGLTCTTPPQMNSVVTGSAITQVNVTTAGAGCSYTNATCPGGNNCAVPLVFGASCGGMQCTLLPPETVINMPCAVPLVNNLTIEGIGNPTISTNWNTTSVDPTQMIAFCEPTGQQSLNISVKNINFTNTFIAFYFPFELNHFTLDNVNFMSGVAIPFHAYALGSGYPMGAATGSNVYANPPFLASSFTNIQLNGNNAGFSCGGEWISRNPVMYYGTNNTNLYAIAGGYQTMLAGAMLSAATTGNGWLSLSHYIDFTQFGQCGNAIFTNVTNSNSSGYIPAVDSFLETYLWKTQNGPVSPWSSAVYQMSNGLAAPGGTPTGLGCKFQNAVTDRTTDYQFGFISYANAISSQFTSYTGPQNYPYFQCFPGYTGGSLFIFQPRYSGTYPMQNPSVRIQNVTNRGLPAKPIMMGRFDDLQAANVSAFFQSSVSDTLYQQTGETRGLFLNSSTRASLGGFLPWIRLDGLTAPTSATGPTTSAGAFPALRFLNNGLDNNANAYYRNVVGYGDKVTQLNGSIQLPSGTPAPITAGTCITGSIAFNYSGLVNTGAVAVSPAADPGAAFVWSAFIVTPGAGASVTVKLCAMITATPVQTTYSVRVMQ